ncbi:MAG: tRNA 2-selenouridine(34) synthase MnmH, partial [Gammaproteobacteria bacterium]|nr:tRNA 2-selenouridine(34) synthase MnmH [Gammaproteobacteria bacterium]
MQSNAQKYAQLFINDSPLLDVRAPVEFQRGAFPNAINLPLLDDEQREIVGKCYKQHGQKTAIEKGHELVHASLREARVAAWASFASQYPNGSLYCFRGGLRSEIAQQWLRAAGVKLPRIEGGYKALRSFLINELDTATTHCMFRLVGGKTGSAKTDLVQDLHNAVDLEAAACHRGSSFGRHVQAQNNQINFENILAIEFLKLQYKNVFDIVLEDESRTIGRVGLPSALFAKMRASPIVVIEASYETRLERLIQEYVVEMHSEFVAQHGNNAFKAFSDYLLQAL